MLAIGYNLSSNSEIFSICFNLIPIPVNLPSVSNILCVVFKGKNTVPSSCEPVRLKTPTMVSVISFPGMDILSPTDFFQIPQRHILKLLPRHHFPKTILLLQFLHLV